MTHPQTQDDEALVEVMAEAIADATCIPWRHTPEDDDDMSILASRQLYRRCARAALTAFRNHEGRKW